MLEFSNEKIDLFKDFIENHDFFYIIVTESEKWEKFCFSLGIFRVF